MVVQTLLRPPLLSAHFLHPVQQRLPANFIHHVNHAWQKSSSVAGHPGEAVCLGLIHFYGNGSAAKKCPADENFVHCYVFHYTSKNLVCIQAFKIQNEIAHQKAVFAVHWALGTGHWALGTCYMDNKEYCCIQPGLHFLGTFAAQGMIFVWMMRGLSVESKHFIFQQCKCFSIG